MLCSSTTQRRRVLSLLLYPTHLTKIRPISESRKPSILVFPQQCCSRISFDLSSIPQGLEVIGGTILMTGRHNNTTTPLFPHRLSIEHIHKRFCSYFFIMQSLVKPFVRGFFTRAEPIHLSSPNRSILEKYRYRKVNIAKVNQQLQGTPKMCE